MRVYDTTMINDGAGIHTKLYDDSDEIEIEIVDAEGDNLAVYLEFESCRQLIESLNSILHHEKKTQDLENV